MIELPASGRERAVAGVLVGGAGVFAGLAAIRVPAVGFVAALSLPLVLLVADLLIAVAVTTRWYPIRPVAQGLAVFGLLVHVLVALRNGPVPMRGCAGVLVVAHGWALVLLFLLTAAEDDDESDDPDREASEVPEIVETPVSEVVELRPAREHQLEERSG